MTNTITTTTNALGRLYNSDAALEAAAHAGHASVEAMEAASHRERREASTFELSASGSTIEARLTAGTGTAPLERIILAAGEARGWTWRTSAGEGGTEREVTFAGEVNAAELLEDVAAELRRVGVGQVVIAGPPETEVPFA